MKLSIIIPTLNEQEYLPNLLASIRSQRFNDCEIIVADAGSSDRTLVIASSYNCKVVQGGLPAKGRNEGAKIARGEILLFLDADVTLPPDFLKNVVRHFTQCKLGIAGFSIHPVGGNSIDVLLYGFMRVVAHAIPWSAVAMMATVSTHKIIGGFREDITLCEDVFYALQAAKVSRYGYIAQPFFTSTRRYKKDGRVTYLKYFFAFLHTLWIGPVTSGVFNYKFNHYKNENSK